MTQWPIDCVLIGDESLLQRCGDVLRAAGATIGRVVTDDEANARWARALDIPCAPFAETDPVALGAGAVDVVFSVGNLRVLSEAWLAVARVRTVNFHDGPLPDLKGVYVTSWALLADAREHGITWHEATAAIDGGAVLEEARFAVAADETALTLNVKCYDAGLAAFERLVDAWRAGTLQPRPQADRPSRLCRRRDRPAAAGFVDPAAGLDAADRVVRALDFGPYENPLCTPWAWIDGVRRPMTRALLDDLRAGRGPALGMPPADVLTRIGACHTAWATREPHWREALRTLAPIDVPLSRTSATGRHERRLDLEDAAHGDPARTAAAVLVWLSRVSDRTAFDVGCRLSTLDAAVTGLEPWFEPLPPCRLDVAASSSFAAAVSHVATMLAAHEARGTYLADLVTRDPALAKSVSAPLWASGVAVVRADADLGPHDLATALTLVVTGDGQVVFSFDAATVSPEVVDAYTRSCNAFLRAGAATPDAALVDLPLVDDDHRRRFAALNDTTAAIGGLPTIVGQFEAQVAATPDATAVLDGAQTLTYRELDRRATAVAYGLVTHGIRRGDVVGLHLERSADLVAAVLGVLKSGAAYLPVDPAYPVERTAFVIEDAAARLVVTSATLASRLPASATPYATLDAIADAGARTPGSLEGPMAADLAYAIYTSGSTGRPKGVLLEHRHVISFFAAMDPCVERRDAGVWLAVTSLSFDISVLELLWTVCRGFAVVVHDGRPGAAVALGATAATTPAAPIDLSLFYFSADETAEPADRYRLLLEGARFADAHGFEAVWTPERHFHAFGGLYPNPAITSAAIAASTSRVKIRAGSLVLPLHHPVRAAEDWALVDNLSRGRVGVAFASGWHPNDFVLAPHNYGRAKQAMFEGLDLMRRLWRGEKVPFTTPAGEEVVIGTLPRPVQPELPYWVTTAGNPDTFRQAGEIGANVLTHLLGQTVEEVRAKIDVYREARRAAGHAGPGHVTLMLHTFVGASDDEVRATVRGPMKRYLGTSLNLVQKHAWSFPAFKGRTAASGADTSALFDQLSPDDLDALLEHAFERYFETGGLFGSVETCAATIERLRGMGVDEVACLVDFGVPTDAVLASLPRLAQVRERAVRPVLPAPAAITVADALTRYGVTHLQCTPSLAALLVDDAAAAPGLARLQHWLVGGEALSETLAAKIRAATSGRVTNMYGPTETTVWSLTYDVRGGETSVPIGTPIANTHVHVLDSAGVEVPAGLPGELYIGGPGVARGYHARPELTAERFVEGRVPGAGRLYRTGDRVRLGSDGLIEFLGRIDHQVKIRGHRIELGEIEAALRAVPGVAEAVAVVRDGAAGDARLVAYVTAAPGAGELVEPCRRAARAWLPDVMVPAVVVLDALPRTPNGKIDRKRLPAPASHTPAAASLTPVPIADPWQQRVAEIWTAVLGAPAVGLDDNFFDLGGHSLLTVQVAARLGEVVGRAVPVTDLFRFPTVRGLAAHLGGEPALAGAGSPPRPAAGVQAGQARAAARRAALQRR